MFIVPLLKKSPQMVPILRATVVGCRKPTAKAKIFERVLLENVPACDAIIRKFEIKAQIADAHTVECFFPPTQFPKAFWICTVTELIRAQIPQNPDYLDLLFWPQSANFGHTSLTEIYLHGGTLGRFSEK
jgi:hypothetical protein